MKTVVRLLLFLIAFVIDIILGNLFGIGFAQTGNSMSPNLVFITLILITYKEPLFSSLLTALLLGFLMDSFNLDVMILNSVVYMVSVVIVKAWSRRINYSVLELLLTVLAAIFVKEFLLYSYYTLIVGVMMSFETYMLSYFINTLIFNTLLIIISVLVKKHFIEKEIYEQQINKRRASLSSKY